MTPEQINKVIAALEAMASGLEWFRDMYPKEVNEDDHVMIAEKDEALAIMRGVAAEAAINEVARLGQEQQPELYVKTDSVPDAYSVTLSDKRADSGLSEKQTEFYTLSVDSVARDIYSWNSQAQMFIAPPWENLHAERKGKIIDAARDLIKGFIGKDKTYQDAIKEAGRKA